MFTTDPAKPTDCPATGSTGADLCQRVRGLAGTVLAALSLTGTRCLPMSLCEQLEHSDEYSAAMTKGLHDAAADHLLSYVRRGVRQENLCFALWKPSRGDRRFGAVICELVLPEPGEVQLQGNVSFQP